jgi:hypothetical protein
VSEFVESAVDFPNLRAAPRRRSLFLYLCFPAIVMALGWAVGDMLGGATGALVPGALGGLALGLIGDDPGRHRRAALFAVAGALGTAVTFSIAVGPAVSFLFTSESTLRGVLFLVAKGAIRGGLAGACLGMALSASACRLRDALWIIPVAALVYAGNKLPSETGELSKTLGVLLILAVVWLAVWKEDRAAMLLTVCGALGFGIGCPIAFWLYLKGAGTGIRLDWWGVAHLLWGAFGGLALGLGGFAIDENDEQPRPLKRRWPRVAAVIAIAWLIPALLARDMMTFWIFDLGWLPAWSLHGYHAAVALLLILGCWFAPRWFRDAIPARRAAGLLVWLAATASVIQFAPLAMPSPLHLAAIWTQLTYVAMLIVIFLIALRQSARSEGEVGSL